MTKYVPGQQDDGPITDRAIDNIERIMSEPIEITTDEDYLFLGSLVEDESDESLALEE